MNTRRAARSRTIGVRLLSPVLSIFVLVFVVLPLIVSDPEEVHEQRQSLASLNLVSGVASVAISAEGHYMAATCRDESFGVWDRTLPVLWERLKLAAGDVRASGPVAFSPDATCVAVVGRGGAVIVLNLPGGEPRFRVPGDQHPISAVAFSPDGRTMATGSFDARVTLLDARTGIAISSVADKGDRISCLTFSADGRHLASAGDDRIVRVWGLSSEPVRCIFRSVPQSGHVISLALSPSGDLVASCCAGEPGIRIWESATSLYRGILTGRAWAFPSLAFAQNGKHLVAGDSRGIVVGWDVATRRERFELPAHDGWVRSIAITRDGRNLITGGDDGFLRVWDWPPASHDS